MLLYAVGDLGRTLALLFGVYFLFVLALAAVLLGVAVWCGRRRRLKRGGGGRL